MTMEPPKSFYTGTPSPKVKASRPLNFVKQDNTVPEKNIELRIDDTEGITVVNKKLNKVIFHIDPQGRQIETPYDVPEKDVL